ncbi:MAG: hypothetical protein JSS27_08035 [Planctomycetes bacterium]|nr:hypothetical protein [Planctomycetota bacterium]
MATKKVRRSGEDAVPFTPVKRKPRGGRLWHCLIVAAVLLVVFAAAFPTVVSRTPLGQKLIHRATSDLDGKLAVGSLSIGWWSPLAARDIELTDASGQLVARVPAVEGDKRLWDLLWSPHQLGRIRVTNPQLNVVLDDQSSNLEQMFAKYLTPSDQPSSSASVHLQLEVVDATITVNDALARRQSELSQLNFQVIVDGADGVSDIAARGLARSADGGGPFQAQVSLRSATDAHGRQVPMGRLVLQAQDFPLGLPQVLLRRLQTNIQLAGRMSSDLNCEWGLDQSGNVRQSAKGQVNFRQLSILVPKLSGEPLRLAQLDIPCDLTWENNQARVTRLQAVCDIGKLSLQADVAEADKLLDLTDAREIARHLSRGNNELQMRVDLAQLARLMPQTLRVRDDTQVASGQLDVELNTRREPAGYTWLGRIEASRLVAVHDGREVSWDQPLRIAFAARDEQRGLVVDRLQCQSNFIQVEGAGTADACQLNSTLDLQRLSQELGKFVDLSNIRLAGRGTAQMAWQRQPDGAFQTGGQLTVDGFELATAGAAPWTEQQLVFSFGARGSLDQQQNLQQVASAQAKLVSGTDLMLLNLSTPVAHPTVATSWPVELSMQGSLGTWRRRLTPAIGPLPGLNAEGQMQVTGVMQLSSSVVDVEKCELSVTPLQVNGWSLFIDEPAAKCRLVGRWDRAQNLLDLKEATLETSVATLRSRDARLGLAAASAHLTQGEITADANLHKLLDWFQDPRQPRSWEVSGAFKGRAVFNYQSGKTTLTVDANAENVLATPRGSRQWHEPSIRWLAAAEYDRESDKIEVKQCELQSDMLALQVAGKLEELSARRMLQVDGRINYDLAKVQRIVAPYVGPNLQLAGQQSRTFSFVGPLNTPTELLDPKDPNAWLKPFTGRAELGWDWMNLYGLKMNKAQLTFDLREGWLRCLPVELPIGGGRMNLAPVARLSPAPAELQHAPAVLLDHVELSPEMCGQAIAYAAPMLAGVTHAQGQISLAISDCRVPLAAPSKGDLSGKLTLHSVDIAGGPIMQELAMLVGANSALQFKRESEMQFRMVNGRIFHQGLELATPTMSFRTQGSVGLDQSLALMVEMPVPQQWLGNNPMSSPLRNQLLRVPVGGTITRPGLDRQELDRQAGELFRNSAATAVQDGLNRGLDALLGPAARREGNTR